MPDKAAKYEAGEGDALESRREIAKLRQDEARKFVRKIQSYPVLSDEWMALSESLHQLAKLAQIDTMMPCDLKVQDQVGRNDEGGGTLWDQEQNENTIKILVEEAKVNLCLRVLTDYKTWHYNASERSATISTVLGRSSGAEEPISESALERKCLQFEESLGFLLQHSFWHQETLQLTDIPLLIEHCAMVMTNCERFNLAAPTNAKTQETVVIHYFAALMKWAENLNNSELLNKLRESGLLHCVVRHMKKHQESYALEVRTSVVEGLSCLADNEDFQTMWQDFFQDDADGSLKASFLELETSVVDPIIAKLPAKKREWRPLLDFFAKLKRS